MELLIVLVVVGVAVLLIISPLRQGGQGPEPTRSADRADLEAAKEAKYREIRDAELDYRTGKLSRRDWEWLDAALRVEAVELLHRIDVLEAHEQGGGEGPPRGVDSDLRR